MINKSIDIDLYTNDYVVYSHSRASDGQVFYIGMGSKRRPFSKKRGIRWQRYINKYGTYTVEIIKSNLSVYEALYLESFYIIKFGRKGFEDNGVLVNMKLSDIGVSGMRHTEESKRKISKAFAGANGVNTGRKATEANKLNMSLARRGKSWDDNMYMKMDEYFKKKGFGKYSNKKPKLKWWETRKIEIMKGNCFKCHFKVIHRFTKNGMRPAFYLTPRPPVTQERKDKIGNIHRNKIVSLETRQKMSNTRKEKTWNSTPVLDTKTGVSYKTATAASVAIGKGHGYVYACIKGHFNHAKYRFIYI